MNFEEHAGKSVLNRAGVSVPQGRLCASAQEAEAAARAIGPVVVKAQVPTGKRGKSGGVKLAATPEEASAAAQAILGMEIGGFPVARVLVEEQAAIAREFYAAVLNDPASRSPLVLFSTEGGMDIEEVAATRPESLRRMAVDIRKGFGPADARRLLLGLDLGEAAVPVAGMLVDLYRVYRLHDAELLEINPLALLANGRVVPLDCKLTVDDSALYRQADIAELGAREPLSALEERGRALDLKYIELEGNVGVLANGAGLTMTTMDVVSHAGGRPSNFLEIGGEAYTKGTEALDLVLSNPGVKSLVVNFCGAFARTDVMAGGVIQAWKTLNPTIPVFFSIHGTGEDEAVRMVREELGIEPYDRMEDAISAAVEAAR
ncbi:succinate--CoA ligase [Azospirillum brasilense]|uniref:ATP-grasp domain-containing protein n=1 Tax=Azospirillum brasilense TaxID=192 RepID=A0A0P0FF54_AZOBR|nr:MULTISPECIES: ATP-grasp domain-containing protein [Azospirillum]ALJ38900.1 succinate--CoA ligase [Azospirillum brasilense]MDW7557329.1 ATP-grasp domain-containing protein [Azospirillum brasilense]MDW7596998.1 ATP-grasp domain-containing protein [Azospirillum brasilense]MDW7632185.1 ATP-grasp domain-containing protein [Azospirillum brasilense]MDX5950708.1 ATP-grasp domain-containing protein [Azospirillum brasilense]